MSVVTDNRWGTARQASSHTPADTATARTARTAARTASGRFDPPAPATGGDTPSSTVNGCPLDLANGLARHLDAP